jgi:hypothetical protein
MFLCIEIVFVIKQKKPAKKADNVIHHPMHASVRAVNQESRHMPAYGSVDILVHNSF